MNRSRKIRVLVVDDSPVVCRVITGLLGHDSDIEVVGTAGDPYEARDLILALEPDLLTLDIDLPRMGGLAFLRILREHRPLPVVIVSSFTQEGSLTALEALSAGAVEVISKSSPAWGTEAFSARFCERIKAAARAKLVNSVPIDGPRVESATVAAGRRQILLIGASTGGTEALRHVLTRLPETVPGICIVQHFPPGFSRAFARRLEKSCAFDVREASDGDPIRPGLALVAPGDYHMVVQADGDHLRARLVQTPPVHHTRPSVDVLFDSAARVGASAVAVLLTGMGTDGARGMQALKAQGARTLVQDETSCVIYGMPRAAVELGVVDHVVPLVQMPHAIIRALHAQATVAAALPHSFTPEDSESCFSWPEH
jgi:two-component system, chemotaxis family, protein-glutamate methylesterase/glutaminase